MDVTKYKVLQLGLLLFQFVFSVSVVGAYTGWFKNDMDLLKTVSLIGHLLLVFAIVLPSHVYLFIVSKKGGSVSLGIRVCFIATVLCLVITVAYNIYIFGGMYPKLEGTVRNSYKHEFTDANGHKVEYWVELVNPFHSSHKERLILKIGDKKRVIDVKLKDRPGTFLSGPKDISITQEDSHLLLESQLAVDTRYVVIDYKSGTVLSNWIKGASSPRGAEGGSVGKGSGKGSGKGRKGQSFDIGVEKGVSPPKSFF